MGEYHHHNNGTPEGEQTLKLGTTDDWRYVRREEALRLRACDVGHDLRGGLEDTAILWRFPFPWEDQEGMEAEMAARSMFKTVCLSAEPIAAAFREGVEHGHVVVCLANGTGPVERGGKYNPERSGYQLNVWVPCPFRSDFNLKTSIGGPVPNLTIYGERFDAEGHRRTIYRCGYCETPFSLGPEETETLRASLVKSGESVGYEWMAKLGARLSARPPEEAPAAAAVP